MNSPVVAPRSFLMRLLQICRYQSAKSAALRVANGRNVSGQAGWSHWHAISTSSLPASRHACPQYSSPLATSQRHGMCAHLFVF